MRNRQKKEKGGPAVHLLGLVGLLCIGVAVIGLFSSSERPDERKMAQAAEGANEVAESLPAGTEDETAGDAAVESPAVSDDEGSYYPLEVGRYWVYVRSDPATGRVSEVERRIVRRESHADRDLYFFEDGTMVYREDGRVFEVGPEGGVNVVPVDDAVPEVPYLYRSQGLRIEKEVGARDTALVLEGQRYVECVQVITRFHREGSADTISYASYYARGVGMVGREVWPRGGGEHPTVVLKRFGQNL